MTAEILNTTALEFLMSIKDAQAQSRLRDGRQKVTAITDGRSRF
jgi:hypothetical protein